MGDHFWGSGELIQSSKPLAARADHDFYPSPDWVVEAALNLIPDTFVPSTILDPGAGTGVWGRYARKRYPYALIRGIEIRPVLRVSFEYDEWFTEDYLQGSVRDTDTNCRYDLVIGNPPYGVGGDRNYAEKFVRKAYGSLITGGYLVFLLRMAFLASQSRGAGLYKQMPPKEVAVLSKRPSFMPTGHPKEGKTDATEYAIFVWQKGYHGETKLRWIP
jgi:hypothetical protein